jgi:heat shock protein 4
VAAGSATRSPIITSALEEHFGKTPQRTLNSEEAVSKGCALMGAMLSPSFKVREFAVVDSTPYAIALSWSPSPGAEKMEVDDEAAAATGKGNVVFTEHNVMPSTKMLTFMRPATFDITASYAEGAGLAPGASPAIAVATINVPPPPAGEEATKVKVKVRLDFNGVLSVDSAQAIEEVEVEEPPKAEAAAAAPAAAPAEGTGDAPMADAPPAGDAGEPAEASAAEPAGQAASEDKAAEAAKPAEAEPQKKKKTKKHDLQVVNKAAFQLVPTTIDAFKNEEFEMSVQDRQIRELQEKKNDLEAYIYTMRDRVSSGNLQDYISQADKDKFLPMLDEMENWLYEEEAETANKSTFIAKLGELQKVPDAARSLRAMLSLAHAVWRCLGCPARFRVCLSHLRPRSAHSALPLVCRSAIRQHSA